MTYQIQSIQYIGNRLWRAKIVWPGGMAETTVQADDYKGAMQAVYRKALKKRKG